jgi:CRAL/TRIO domain.
MLSHLSLASSDFIYFNPTQVLNILQDHYPERLGLSLVINVPFLLNAFFRVIHPFIDPVTRTKLKFNPKVIEEDIFKAGMLMKEWWGGDCNFIYEHEKYWPVLVEMCEERRRAWVERWRALGGTIGLKEWDYKGGEGEICEKVEVVSEVLEESTGYVGKIQEANPQ